MPITAPDQLSHAQRRALHYRLPPAQQRPAPDITPLITTADFGFHVTFTCPAHIVVSGLPLITASETLNSTPQPPAAIDAITPVSFRLTYPFPPVGWFVCHIPHQDPAIRTYRGAYLASGRITF